MARIIDLKNNKTAPKPQNGGRFSVQDSRPKIEVKPAANVAVLPKPAVESKTNESARPEPKVISWSGRLYRQPDFKSVFSVSLILFAAAALIGIFQKNLITSVLFGLLGIVLLMNAKKKPRESSFEISPIGVKAAGKLYGYREIKSFWIEYEPVLGIKELSIQLKKWYLPYVKIPLDEQNPIQIRQLLLVFIPEIEHKDTMVEILSRKLGI